MKKILAILLAAMMLLSLAACGGDKDPKPSGSTAPGASQPAQQPGDTPGEGTDGGGKADASMKGATAENWNTVLKDNIGMELELPEGWKVNTVEAGKSFIKVYFITDYDQSQNDDLCVAFSEKIFDQTKAVASGDVYDFNDIDKKSLSFSDIAETSKVDLEAPYGDDVIQVFYSWFMDEFEVFISIL